MTKKFVELTVAFEDDPTINPNNVVEAFHRSKEGEAGAWGNPSETQNCASTSILGFGWVELEVKKV